MPVPGIVTLQWLPGESVSPCGARSCQREVKPELQAAFRSLYILRQPTSVLVRRQPECRQAIHAVPFNRCTHTRTSARHTLVGFELQQSLQTFFNESIGVHLHYLDREIECAVEFQEMRLHGGHHTTPLRIELPAALLAADALCRHATKRATAQVQNNTITALDLPQVLAQCRLGATLAPNIECLLQKLEDALLCQTRCVQLSLTNDSVP